MIKEWDFCVLLFYKYVPIENPEEFMREHRALCERLGIKGRYAIAHEGINGTCEGTPEAIKEYVQEFTKDPRFSDIHFKYSKGTGNAFPKLKMRVRPEIVSLGLKEDDINPNEITGTYLPPSELHQWFENKDDFVIVDMRNQYEHQIGHFPNSILPNLKNFRDLPKIYHELEHLKDKKVLTVCTGGVRCEKASGFLKKKGFTNVHQLQGGMVSYMEQYPGENFLGAMYSFDGRVVIDYDEGNHPIIGRCIVCVQPSENIVDCKNVSCHGQVILCTTCLETIGKVYCKDRCDSHLSIFGKLLKKLPTWKFSKKS